MQDETIAQRICSVEGCNLPHRAKGLCITHWARLRRNGHLEVGNPSPKPCSVEGCNEIATWRGWCRAHYPKQGACSVEGCEKQAKSRGLCPAHYARLRKNGTTDDLKHLRQIHGHAKKDAQSPTYRTHKKMLDRCLNPNYRHYDYYGGRGITICERWQGENGFLNFLADMGERPEGTSLDRIDPNGNYEPSNCRWATSKQQGENKRRRRDSPSLAAVEDIRKRYAQGGITQRELAEEYKVHETTIRNYLKVS